MGHCPIRANREIQPEGQKPLPPGTYTVARLFQENGYATACTGKWGLGMFDTTGQPAEGRLRPLLRLQLPAARPQLLPRVPLPRRQSGSNSTARPTPRTSSPRTRSIGCGRTRTGRSSCTSPLRCRTASTRSTTSASTRPPTGRRNRRPTRRWSRGMDSDIGRLLALLEGTEARREDARDLSPATTARRCRRTRNMGQFFEQARGLRGIKRGMYEGGLRQAAIARWPGQVPAGKVCDEPWAFWDFLPTCAELIGAKTARGRQDRRPVDARHSPGRRGARSGPASTGNCTKAARNRPCASAIGRP